MTITRTQAKILKAAIEGLSGGAGVTECEGGLAETNIELSTVSAKASTSTADLISGASTVYGAIITRNSSGGLLSLREGTSFVLRQGNSGVGVTQFFLTPVGIPWDDSLNFFESASRDFTIFYTQ